MWLSRKFSFSLLVVSRSGGSAAEGVPEAAHSRPTEQSTLIDRLIAARVASSSSTTGGEHFLGGDLAMAPGCHCQQLLTRAGFAHSHGAPGCHCQQLLTRAGFAHSHGAPARRAPSYGTGLPLPAAADTGRLCPLARHPGKTGA